MSYLLTQMFLYLLVCFLLGLLLGWLIWRYGQSATAGGDMDALRAERDRLHADLEACRARGAEMEEQTNILRGERAQLQSDLDDCRAASSAPRATMVAPAPTAAAAAVVEEGTKPEGLSAPRGGQADDLQRIHGIGPKLERLLHSLGYYHFDQIASWNDEELAWVDSHLEGFHGRASRDQWVPQARQFAQG